MLYQYQDVLRKVGGILIIIFGLYLLGILKLKFFMTERRLMEFETRPVGYLGSFLIGTAFAAGWTPCVGPILSSILAISMSSEDVGRGAALLAVYSAGLGIPFVFVGLFIGRLKGTLGWLKRHGELINRIAGVLLMFLGVLIFFDELAGVSSWLLRNLPSFEIL